MSADPFDPVSMAMRSLHQGNLIAAKEAKEKNLVYAGDQLARVLEDVAESNQLDAIARAVVIATVAKWHRAKEGQQ